MKRKAQDYASGEVVKHRETGETYTIRSIDPGTGIAEVVDSAGRVKKIHRDYLQSATATIRRRIAQETPPAEEAAPAEETAPEKPAETAEKAPSVKEPKGEPSVEITAPPPAAPAAPTPPAPSSGIASDILYEVLTDTDIAPIIVEKLIEKLTTEEIASALPESTLEEIAESGITASLIRRKGFEIISSLALVAYKRR